MNFAQFSVQEFGGFTGRTSQTGVIRTVSIGGDSAVVDPGATGVTRPPLAAPHGSSPPGSCPTHRTATPALDPHRPLNSLPARIVCGADRAPQPTHPGLAIDSPSGDRAGSAHGFDLRLGKESSPSKRTMRISNSSLSIIRSPTRRLARLSSRSKAATFGSSVRRFSPARPASKNPPAIGTTPRPVVPFPGSAHPGSHRATASAPPPACDSPTNVSRTSRSWTPPVVFTLRPNGCPVYSEGYPPPRLYRFQITKKNQNI